MKNQKFGTSEAVPESKRKIVEREERSVPQTCIYMIALFTVFNRYFNKMLPNNVLQ